MAQRRTAWRIEGRFTPLETAEDVAGLRVALIRNGAAPATASGVVGWLLEKQQEGVDRTASETRCRYRKELQRLADAQDLRAAVPA